MVMFVALPEKVCAESHHRPICSLSSLKTVDGVAFTSEVTLIEKPVAPASTTSADAGNAAPSARSTATKSLVIPLFFSQLWKRPQVLGPKRLGGTDRLPATPTELLLGE